MFEVNGFFGSSCWLKKKLGLVDCCVIFFWGDLCFSFKCRLEVRDLFMWKWGVFFVGVVCFLSKVGCFYREIFCFYF